MLFWVSLFLIEGFFLYKYHTSRNIKRRKILFWIIVINLVYFSGFRDGLGMDYTGYKDLCERNVYNWAPWLLSEPLFSSLQSFCYNTSFSAVLLFLFSAVVTCGGSLWVYSKFENFSLAAYVFIFYTGLYLFSMNVVSQFCAASVVLVGFAPLLQEYNGRNLVLYLISVFVAFLIHRSAFVMLFPLFFFARKGYNSIFIIALIFASIIVSSFNFLKIPVITQLFDVLNYSSYLGYSSAGYDKLSFSNIFMHLLLIPFLLNKKELMKREDGMAISILVKFYVIYLICNNLSTGAITITYRIAVYFAVFIPILLAKLPQIMGKKAYIIIIIPLLILMSVRLSSGDKLTVPDRILPLSSIVDENYKPYENPLL